MMGRSRAVKSRLAATSSDEDEDSAPNASKRSSRRADKPSSIENPPRKSARSKPKPQVVDLSSDEEHDDQSPSSYEAVRSTKQPPAKPQSKSAKLPKGLDSKKTASSNRSPKKTKAASKAAAGSANESKAPPSRTIFSFFNTKIQRQQSQGSASPEKAHTPVVEKDDEDLIQDDSLDDENLVKQPEAPASSYAVPLRKRKLEEDIHTSNGLLSGSQKFLKSANGRSPAPGSQAAASATTQKDTRPWIDRYAPVNLEELAVHKKKVADVRDWLSSALDGRDRKRLLVLKGAAGTGKSATVKLLAQPLNFDIREWHNPSSSDISSEGYVSVASQFDNFIGSTGKYSTLDLFHPDKPAEETPSAPASDVEERHITLVEEIPNAFIHSWSSSALRAFRSTIMQFLAANTPSASDLFSRQQAKASPTPIVMIISESLFNNSSSSVDNVTANRLLGAEILSHIGVTVIELNPVAPTYLTKALELVIRKEARESSRKRAPGPAVLKHLSEIGDVRSAVSALEFICLRGDDPNAWSGRVAATALKGKKNAPSEALTDMERLSLEMVTQRESALGIFHAVGKVVYNKREAPAATDTPPPQPPPYLSHHRRARIPETDTESLLEELGTDIQTFIAALHENYVLSCQSPNSEDTADAINGSIDALSDADLLSSDSLGTSGLFRRAFRGSGGDTLRQEEFSFQRAVRGLLFSLPHPVKRIPPPASLQAQVSNLRGSANNAMLGGRGDAFKMMMPTSLKLWRRKEEIDSLLTALVDKALNGKLRTEISTERSSTALKPSAVDSWRGNKAKFMTPPSTGPRSSPPKRSTDASDDTTTSSLLMGGSSAKREMLLEHLPYMSAIHRASGLAAQQSALLKQIAQVTLVSGLVSQNDDASDDEDDGAETPAFGPRTSLAQRPKKKEQDYVASVVDEAKEEGQAPHLVLSDDDIEDD